MFTKSFPLLNHLYSSHWSINMNKIITDEFEQHRIDRTLGQRYLGVIPFLTRLCVSGHAWWYWWWWLWWSWWSRYHSSGAFLWGSHQSSAALWWVAQLTSSLFHLDYNTTNNDDDDDQIRFWSSCSNFPPWFPTAMIIWWSFTKRRKVKNKIIVRRKGF